MVVGGPPSVHPDEGDTFDLSAAPSHARVFTMTVQPLPWFRDLQLSRIRNWALLPGVVVTTALIVLVVVSVTTVGSHTEPLTWRFAAVSQNQHVLTLSVEDGGCSAGPLMVRVDQNPARVQVLVKTAVSNGTCSDVGVLERVTVRLRQPLSQRLLAGCLVGSPDAADPQWSRVQYPGRIHYRSRSVQYKYV